MKILNKEYIVKLQFCIFLDLIQYNKTMLRDLLQQASKLYKFSKQKDKKSTYFTILQKRLQIDNNPRIEALEQIGKSNKQLNKYFTQKSVNNFTIEDAYYYISNQSKFKNPNLAIRLTLIDNPTYDCFAKFVIAHETMDAKGVIEVEKRLIASFNSSCQNMNNQDLINCLAIMTQLHYETIQSYLNLDVLYNRLNKNPSQFNQAYLDILYYLKNMNIMKKVLNLELAKEHVNNLANQISDRNYSAKRLYFLDSAVQSLQLSNKQKISTKILSLLSSKITSLKSQQEQQQTYTIKLLKSYPKLIKLLKSSQLSSKVYLQYLHFIQNTIKSQQISISIIGHPIPKNTIKTCTASLFYKIIAIRLELNLDRINQLGQLSKRAMAINSQAMLGLLKYLEKNRIQDNLVWKEFQEGFVQKLGLKAKDRDIHKIVQHHNIATLFQIMGIMSANRFGSIYFWKQCDSFVFQILSDNKYTKKIDEKDQNMFVISAFRIYQNKTIPKAIEQNLKNLTLIAMVNNRWVIKELYQLSECLTSSKLIIDEVWIAIEKKLLHSQVNIENSEKSIILIAKIFKNFQIMNVGSYKFKNRIQQILKNKNFDLQAFYRMKKDFQNIDTESAKQLKKITMEMNQLQN